MCEKREPFKCSTFYFLLYFISEILKTGFTSQHYQVPLSLQFFMNNLMSLLNLQIWFRPELVKEAGVAQTELQELGGGSQYQPTT